MAKGKISDLVEEMLRDFLAENGLELFYVEYVKGGAGRELRVFIDKPYDPDSEEEAHVDINDCEKVSRYLSDRLDQEDPIREAYDLIVSSPGIDRPLLREQDYIRYAGHLVEISLYQPLEDILRSPEKTELSSGEEVPVQDNSDGEDGSPEKKKKNSGKKKTKHAGKTKQLTAELVGRKDGMVTVVRDSGDTVSIPQQQIAKINLAVIF